MAFSVHTSIAVKYVKPNHNFLIAFMFLIDYLCGNNMAIDLVIIFLCNSSRTK